jgi:SAM-dependent methyltransferase
MAYEQTKSEYDKHGEAYHAKREDPSRSYYNTFLEVPAMTALLKDEVGGNRVLDLGCGSGIFTALLAEWGADVCGIDASETLVEIAKREHPGIEFVSGDAAALPYADAEFDIVSSSLVAHYFEDLTPLFTDVARVTKPGGRFVFSFHHPTMEVLEPRDRADGEGHEYLLNEYFNNAPYEFALVPGMQLTAYHHTFEDVVTALADAGFVVEFLREPRPAPESRRFNKESYDRITRYPSFCIIGARRGERRESL